MRRRTAIAALLSICGTSSAQPAPAAGGAGRWRGDARLFNARLRAKVGEIPAELVFQPDGSLSGTLGEATIPASRPKIRSRERVQYQLVLLGEVHRDLARDLNHLVVLVTPRPETGLDADFHLKTRFGFDPAMLVGHFDVRRIE